MRYILSALAAALALGLASCLEKDLEDLEVYGGSDITAGFAYYRYVDRSATIAASGENRVVQRQYTLAEDPVIAVDAQQGTGTISLTFTPSGTFSEAERAACSLNPMVVAVSVSTAAVVTPLDGSPALGTPADWTRPHTYEVRAANGTSKRWTINVALNK